MSRLGKIGKYYRKEVNLKYEWFHDLYKKCSEARKIKDELYEKLEVKYSILQGRMWSFDHTKGDCPRSIEYELADDKWSKLMNDIEENIEDNCKGDLSKPIGDWRFAEFITLIEKISDNSEHGIGIYDGVKGYYHIDDFGRLHGESRIIFYDTGLDVDNDYICCQYDDSVFAGTRGLLVVPYEHGVMDGVAYYVKSGCCCDVEKCFKVPCSFEEDYIIDNPDCDCEHHGDDPNWNMYSDQTIHMRIPYIDGKIHGKELTNLGDKSYTVSTYENGVKLDSEHIDEYE